jgi:hypothetical protein
MRPGVFVTITALVISGCVLHAQSKPSQSNPAISSNTGSKPAPIPPAKAAKIEEMLTLTGLKPTLEQRIAEEKRELKWYAHVQSSILKGVPKDKEAQEQGITAAYVKDMNGIAEAQLTWEKIKPSIIRYCADNFTDEQIDSIMAFYKSSTGKLMLEKGKALNTTTAAAMHGLEIQTKQITDKDTEDMQAKVQALLPPAPSSPSPSASTEPVRTNSSSALDTSARKN